MIVELTVASIGGAVLGYFLGHRAKEESDAPMFDFLRSELTYYRNQLEVSQDRLVHAHLVDKAIVPPRPVEIRAPEPLAAVLQEKIDEWESPEIRAHLEATIRARMHKGMSAMEVLKSLENDHP